MEPSIGVFSNAYVTCNIYPSTIKNPYSVYLPKIENNQIQEFIHINETLITKFLLANELPLFTLAISAASSAALLMLNLRVLHHNYLLNLPHFHLHF